MSFINYVCNNGPPYIIHSSEFDNQSLSLHVSSSFNPQVDNKHAYISEVHKYSNNLIYYRVTAVVHVAGYHDHYVHAEFGAVGRLELKKVLNMMGCKVTKPTVYMGIDWKDECCVLLLSEN